jgi:hypothetical protein
MTKRIMFILLIVILSYTIGPILIGLIGAIIATIGSCQVDEGSVHPCILLGMNLGGLLYRVGLMPWLALITIPTGEIALGVWGIMASLIWIVTWKKKQTN